MEPNTVNDNNVDYPDRIEYIQKHPDETYQLLIRREEEFKRVMVERNMFKKERDSFLITLLIVVIILVKVAGSI